MVKWKFKWYDNERHSNIIYSCNGIWNNKLLFTKYLQVLELGDEFATTLGIRLNLVRIILILSAVFLIAFATSTTGPIAFVAFLAGPIASKIVGRGSSNVLASGLVGALLVLSSDMIGQYVFSTRFPVGVITGILGAPYMLFY